MPNAGGAAGDDCGRELAAPETRNFSIIGVFVLELELIGCGFVHAANIGRRLGCFKMSGEFFFDKEAADRAVDFYPRFLRHIKGDWAGKPIELAEWQKERIVRPLFGWKRADGTRRYRTVFLFVPRKNGKSTFAAGLANQLLFTDKEKGAEVYSAAADREQAGIVFDAAKAMVEMAPALRKRSRILKRVIHVPRSRSFYKVLSSDGSTKHGFNPHAVVMDELHAIPGAREGSIVEALTTAQASRSQPVTINCTTAGYDRRSIAYSEYKYAKEVLDGVREDPTYLPVLFELEKDQDWEDPATWAAANPNLGISVYPEYLEEQYRRAKGSPALENAFKRLHLNVWTEQATRWIPIDAWNACEDTDLELEDLEGCSCTAGLDLSTTEDISALVLAFRLDDGRVAIFPFFWIPEETAAERARAERMPYLDWIKRGLVYATPGNVVDYSRIREKINELAERFDITDLAFDRWNATQLASELADDGLPMTAHNQNFSSLAPPTDAFQRLWMGSLLAHDGNPVLKHQAANVAVKQNTDGFLKPAKDISGDRIDGIVASIMAIGRLVISEGGFDSADDIVRLI